MDPIQLTFDITLDDLARAVEAYCAIYFYQPDDGDPTDFFKQKCIDWVTQNVTNYELSKATQEAVQVAQENIDEIIIT